MALEHFKTQVLLLHSQQSTLDALSAGFGERYAVHLATSGTEALNTLGATPIHVIVSAQDLPGMSGLEALREARKRSPDTIGILLAGNDRDDGLEALVGDKEVFQIVRGTISPEALRNLIDTATKQIRLLAISESANDQAADVDEPAGEHIVMETSEHGRAIISDGTGTLPVLQPHTVPVSPDAGSRGVEVLVLTKDEEFLQTIKQSARGLHNVHAANTPAQAETLVRAHKVGVLVTDAAMVGSNIEAVTEKLRAAIPRLVAIVAGRRDDGELLMDLINRGQVYRFLLKPVSPGRARLAIEASVKHHLEAADSAFGGKARAGVQAIAPKPAEKPRAAPRIAAVTRATVTRAAVMRAAPARKAPAQKTAPPLRDSGRFTDTTKRLAESVGESLNEAAVRSAGDGGLVAALKNPKILSAGGAALIVIGAAVWWLGTSDTAVTAPDGDTVTRADDSAPSVVETDISVRPSGDPAPAIAPPAWRTMVDEARIARDAGQLIAPPQTNAIELYIAARTMAPDEPLIAAELEAVIQEVLALAESALLAERTNEAAAALSMVRLANPDNPRLPFLDAQVADLELRAHLGEARAAIREGRFEDAATAVTAAEGLAGDNATDVLLLTEELAAARSAQQVDEVLTRANQRLSDNALTAPSNDNARYYYELVLSSDADNAAARQGLIAVASKLVLRARDAIDEGRFDDAEDLLQDAHELDPDNSDLSASAQALETVRAEAEALRQAELARQAELERQAEAQAGVQAALSAPATGEEAAADEPGNSAGGPADSAGATDAVGAPASTPTGAYSFAAASGDALTESGAAGDVAPDAAAAGTGGETADTASADESGSGAGGFVPISSLKRTNYVVPDYPRSARRRNITGWVDVSFTVTARGTVENVGILDSNPGDVFIEPTTEAVSQWRFEPPMEDGYPVDKRVAVRLSFDLQ